MTSTAKALPDLRTRSDVAEHLGVPLRLLTWWIWGLAEDRRYSQFELARRSGTRPRIICAPIAPIKEMQRTLAKTLAIAYRPPPHAHGYVPTRGPITAGAKHQRQRWVLKADIQDFFPTINFGRVEGMFGAHPFNYPDEVAVVLAALCCYKRELPQGAPTSPIISNLICRGMDKQLAALASKERCFYTRYADDICFSTNRSIFPASLAHRSAEGSVLGDAIREVVKSNGFKINDDKTCLIPDAQRQRVTGLVVNAKVNVSRDYVRSLRNILYIWKRHGQAVAEAAFARHGSIPSRAPAKGVPEFRLVIEGRVQHVGAVKGWDSPVYRALAVKMKERDPEFPGPHPVDGAVYTLRLFTEGKTDVQHLLAALRYFHQRNEFKDVSLSADEFSDCGGGDKLLRRCKQFVQIPPEEFCLCVFDTDDPKLLKQAVEGHGWKLWGPKAVAVALVGRPGSETDELCIELLHDEEVLQTEDSKGRRLHLRDEFSYDIGATDDGTRVIPSAAKDSLVQESVFELPSKRSVSLTKSDFATAIEKQREPFNEVSFEGFRGTMEAIREASKELTSAH